MERPKKKDIPNFESDTNLPMVIQCEQYEKAKILCLFEKGYNQACDDWEAYLKWYCHQIIVDMQESPAKEYHKKRLKERE